MPSDRRFWAPSISAYAVADQRSSVAGDAGRLPTEAEPWRRSYGRREDALGSGMFQQHEPPNDDHACLPAVRSTGRTSRPLLNLETHVKQWFTARNGRAVSPPGPFRSVQTRTSAAYWQRYADGIDVQAFTEFSRRRMDGEPLLIANMDWSCEDETKAGGAVDSAAADEVSRT